jgi:transposase
VLSRSTALADEHERRPEGGMSFDVALIDHRRGPAQRCRQLLRYPRQVELQSTAPLLARRRPSHGPDATGPWSYSRLSKAPLRRIKFNDPETGKRLVFLTNNFALPALTITQLYRLRWRVELFFKWIKQHLRIKALFGTTENAVKAKIWIAVSVYVLVAVVKQRLNCSASLYEMLQIRSLTMFE